jgi:3-carboxy-cis,cis-muconate cycloisomerase
MEHEHERAAGAWHAEWRPLRELLVSSGSAASWLRACLEGLQVDAARMLANLGTAGTEGGGSDATALVDLTLAETLATPPSRR